MQDSVSISQHIGERQITLKFFALKRVALVTAAVLSAGALAIPGYARQESAATGLILVAAETQPPSSSAPSTSEPSPEAKMQARFPQPVKVGDLIGVPVLDGQDRTIGYVENVVRSPAGRVRLIVPYSAWFGWPRDIGPLAGLRRPVAVPIEVVAILGRQIDALDMDRPDFDKAPTWTAAGDRPIARDDTIRIAISRR